MTRARALAVLAVLGAAPAIRASESSIRCDGGIVQVGDTKADLLGKCGAPSLRDPREAVVGTLMEGSTVASAAVLSEEWTYNFGPQRFLMRVTLEGGKVVAIQRGGPGYDPALLRDGLAAGRTRCESSALHVGDAKVDLLARCGQPVTLDVLPLRRAVLQSGGGAGAGSRWVQVEVWTYDFGPYHFMAIVTLEDGTVVNVERGGYGYAR